MKWIFALNEKSPVNVNGDSYELMAKVAVRSARINAPCLMPNMIWNGKPTAFTESMQKMGVNVMFHRLSFQDQVDLVANRTDVWRHVAKGAMLRLDIPMIFSELDEQILYTDVDIMFLDDPSKYTFETSLFAFSSEFEYNNFININTGVMILNLAAARRGFPAFLDWTKDNLDWLPDYDQGAIRAYFNGHWERLDQRMNWKPYWNYCKDPIIVHFHGPKPTDFDSTSLLPKFNVPAGHIYEKLYSRGEIGYSLYLQKWLDFYRDILN